MPQYKNAIAAPYVRRFCEKWSPDLTYVEHSYTQAWRLMLSNLNQVGKHYYENGIQEHDTPESNVCVSGQDETAQEDEAPVHLHNE
jgi:hypothetical protein